MSNPQRVARIQALHDVGAKIDDGLEQIKLQTARRDGVRSGQLDAINHLIANCKDPSLDKNTVQHCLKSLQQLQTQSNIMYYISLGSEKQCESHVAEIKKMYDLEVALKVREETLPTPSEIASRPAPPRTLKEMRLAEALNAAGDQKENSTEHSEQKSLEDKATPPEPKSETNEVISDKQPPQSSKNKKLIESLQNVTSANSSVSDLGKSNAAPVQSPPSAKKATRKKKKTRIAS